MRRSNISQPQNGARVAMVPRNTNGGTSFASPAVCDDFRRPSVWLRPVENCVSPKLYNLHPHEQPHEESPQPANAYFDTANPRTQYVEVCMTPSLRSDRSNVSVVFDLYHDNFVPTDLNESFGLSLSSVPSTPLRRSSGAPASLPITVGGVPVSPLLAWPSPEALSPPSPLTSLSSSLRSGSPRKAQFLRVTTDGNYFDQRPLPTSPEDRCPHCITQATTLLLTFSPSEQVVTLASIDAVPALPAAAHCSCSSFVEGSGDRALKFPRCVPPHMREVCGAGMRTNWHFKMRRSDMCGRDVRTQLLLQDPGASVHMREAITWPCDA